jgi:hypothetical protein
VIKAPIAGAKRPCGQLAIDDEKPTSGDSKPVSGQSREDPMYFARECARSFKADAQRSSRHQYREASLIQDRPCDPTKNPLAQCGVTIGTHDE